MRPREIRTAPLMMPRGVRSFPFVNHSSFTSGGQQLSPFVPFQTELDLQHSSRAALIANSHAGRRSPVFKSTTNLVHITIKLAQTITHMVQIEGQNPC